MSIYQSILCRTPIDKGWSGDQKYCAVTADGQKYLLRISAIDRLERKRREYEKMQEVARLDIPMCLPVEFSTCEEGAYSIQSWVEGEDAENLVMSMNQEDQYIYGLDAGRILAKIHTIPAPVDALSWETRFNAKIDRKIAMYENCELKYESGSDVFLEYIARNRHLLEGRPQSYQHGDYHIGNMMIDRNGVLMIITPPSRPWRNWQKSMAIQMAIATTAPGTCTCTISGATLRIIISKFTISTMNGNASAADFDHEKIAR